MDPFLPSDEELTPLDAQQVPPASGDLLPADEELMPILDTVPEEEDAPEYPSSAGAPGDLKLFREGGVEVQDLRLQRIFRNAFGKNVDRHADILNVAIQTGVDANVIEQNYEAISSAWKASKFDATKWRENNRELFDLLMEDPSKAPVLMQDEKMSWLAQNLRKLKTAFDFWDGIGTAKPQSFDPRTKELLDQGKSWEEIRQIYSVEGDPKQAPDEVGALKAKFDTSMDAINNPQQVPTVRDPAADATGIARPWELFTAEYSRTQKGLERSELGFGILWRKRLGRDTWEQEKKVTDLNRELLARDYDAGPVEQVLVDLASVAPSQVASLKATGVGGAAGGALGAAGGAAVGALSDNPGASWAMAKKFGAKGAELGAKTGAAAQSFQLEAGSAYLDFRQMTTDDGVPVSDTAAMGAAILYGEIAAGLEVASLGPLLDAYGPLGRAIKAGSGKAAMSSLLKDKGFLKLASEAGKAWMKSAAAEGGEEFSQQIAQDLLGYVGKSVSAGQLQQAKPFESFVSGADSFYLGALGGVAAAAPGPVVSLATEKVLGVTADTMRQDRAKASQAHIGAMITAADSATVKADPKLAARIVAEASSESGEPVTHAHVDAEAFVTYFQSKNADPNTAATELLGEEGPRLLQQALTTGSRLEVPTAEYMGKWVPAGVAKALEKATTTQRDLPTPAELEQRAAQDAEVRKLAEKFAKEGIEPQSAAESKFIDVMEQQLAATGAATKKDARTQLQLLRALIRTAPERFGAGMTADDLFAHFAVSIGTGSEPVAIGSAQQTQDVEAGSLPLIREDFAKLDRESQVRALLLDRNTGLLNQRAFRELQPDPARPYLAEFDLEGKKLFNDEHGHHSVDGALRIMGSALKAAGVRDGAAISGAVKAWVSSPEEAEQLAKAMEDAINDGVPADAKRVRVSAGVGDREGPRVAKLIAEGKGPLDAVLIATGEGHVETKKSMRFRKQLGERKGWPLAHAPDVVPDINWEELDNHKGLSLKSPEFKALLKQAAAKARPMAERFNAAPQVDRFGAGFDASGLSDHLREFADNFDGDYFDAVYRDETGMLTDDGFARARELAPKKFAVSADMRGLKALNDAFGKPGADVVLNEFKRLIVQNGGQKFDAAHPHGDEFFAQGDDEWELNRFFAGLKHAAERHVFVQRKEGGGGVLQVGVHFVHGIGPDLDTADRIALPAAKEQQGDVPGPRELSRSELERELARLKREGYPDPIRIPEVAADGVRKRDGGVRAAESAPEEVAPEVLAELRATIGRMRKKNREIATAFLDYVLDPESNSKPLIERDMEKWFLDDYGLFDPLSPPDVDLRNGGTVHVGGVPLRKTKRKRGRGGRMPSELLKARLMKSMSAADFSVLGYDAFKQPAFHGTPHDFENFSLQKIGTGEGAQAYGWGLYFASRKEVAEHYRQVLAAGQTPKAPGQLFKVDVPEDTELLDYDLPLAQQPPLVLQKLEVAGVIPNGVARFVEVSKRLDEVLRPANKEQNPDGAHRDSLQRLAEEDRETDEMNRLSAERLELRKRIESDEHALIKSGWTPRVLNSPEGGLWLYANLEKLQGGGAAGARWASQKLRDAGIPGLRYLDGSSRSSGEGSHNYVVWDDGRVRVEKKYYQDPDAREGGQDPRGFTVFAQRGLMRIARIVLNPTADLSTFLHESAHVFLEMFGDLAERPDAPAQVKNDYATALKFLGAESRKDVETKHHERWARGFEAYLMEGKPPSPALAGAFQRFKLWLTGIYRSVAGLGVELNDDIRGVFDRLLATDREIETMKKRMGISAPLFTTPAAMAKALGRDVSPEEWQAYQDEYQESHAHAARGIELRVLKDRLRESESWWKEEVQRQRELGGMVYEGLPARMARQFLWGKGTPGGALIHLDRAVVEATVGAENARRFPLRKVDGSHPGEVAPLFGFNTGEEMLKAIAALKDKDEWVKDWAEEVMRGKFPELFDEREKLREEVANGLHGEHTAAWLARELKALGSKTTVEQLKKAAAEIASKRLAGRLDAGAVLAQERAAANQALAAVQKGDFARAAGFKVQQVVNMYLHRELSQAREDREKFLDLANDLSKPPARARLGKANPVYRDGVDMLLQAFGLSQPRPRETPLPSIGEVAAAIETDGTSVKFDVEELGSLIERGGTWQTLSVAQMRALWDALRNIQGAARAKNRVILDGKRVEKEEVVKQLVAEAALVLREKGAATTRESETLAEKALRFGHSVDGWMLRIETMVGFLVNDDINSTWFKAVMNPLQDGKHKEADILEHVVQPVIKAFDAVPADVRARFMEPIDGKAMFPGHREDLTPPRRRYELLMLGLNYGNEGNAQRLRDGRGMTDAQIRAALDLLSKEEMDWVQSFWDASEEKHLLPGETEAKSLKERAFDVEERDSGLRPEAVQARPLVTRHGTYRGGYVPVVYHSEVENVGKKQVGQALSELLDPSFTRPGTPHSHLKERAKLYVGAISLSPGSLFSYLSKSAHDIAYREALKSVGNLVLTPEVQDALRARLGPDKANLFLPWLRDIGTMRAGMDWGGLNAFTQWLRGNMAPALLGWRPSIAIGDLANLPVAGLDLKPDIYARALADYGRNLTATEEMILSKSGEMRTRRGQLVREFTAAVKSLTETGPLKRGPVGWYRRHGFFFMEQSDRATSMPPWLASYRQALEEGRSEADAVRHADKFVRDRFPSHNAVDLAHLLRDKGFWGMVSVFAGYSNVLYNRQRHILQQWLSAQGLGVKGTAKLTAKTIGKLLALWATGNVLAAMLMGQGPDKEEKWWQWFLRRMAMAPFENFHAELGGSVGAVLTGKRPNPRGSPVSSYLETVGGAAVKAASGEKSALSVVKSAVQAIGLTTGTPVTPINNTLDVLFGDHPDGLDVVHDAVLGDQRH